MSDDFTISSDDVENAEFNPVEKRNRNTEKKDLFFYDDNLDEEDPKGRLFKTTDLAKSQEDNLNKIDQTLDRIGEIGDRTFDRLADQREQIEGAIDNMGEIHADGVQSSQTISAIARKQLLSKLVLICVILVLLFGIVIVLYFGVIKPLIIDNLFTGNGNERKSG